MREKEIGHVTHYFNRLGVAVADLEDGLKIGDTIHIKGHSTDLVEEVDSMQIDHRPVEFAGPGADVAVKVRDHVRDHDVIYKVMS